MENHVKPPISEENKVEKEIVWAFKRNRNKFRALYDECVRVQKELADAGQGHRGHGFDHDILVAQYTQLIAGDQGIVAEMAYIAALLHSLDRMFGNRAECEIDRLLGMLPANAFTAVEIKEIKTAVMNHDGPNEPNDSKTKVVLQDADRLANIGALIIVRSGQHFPTIPAVELGHTEPVRHPESDYRNPRSCHDDIIGCLEWDDHPKFGLRLEKSKVISKPYFDFLRLFFDMIKRQFEETGLDKWPISE